MIRVLLRVKNKHQTESLEKLGSIVYKSPVLNVVTLEMPKEYLGKLNQENNVLSFEVEPEGKLMPV